MTIIERVVTFAEITKMVGGFDVERIDTVGLSGSWVLEQLRRSLKRGGKKEELLPFLPGLEVKKERG